MTVVLNFGKYKGKSIDKVPVDYLEWLLENNTVVQNSTGLRRAIKAEVAKRRGGTAPERGSELAERLAEVERVISWILRIPPVASQLDTLEPPSRLAKAEEKDETEEAF